MTGENMVYDAVLIHPPAIYDFRKKTIFPGPIGYTVGESTDQFMIPPVGMLSIADYLDRNKYKVIVDNLCERMVTSGDFDAEEYIKSLSARVYAIGLHWCVHSQGAIEVARLCRELHPEAMIVLGGLTATVFGEEIIRRYDFVDAVIRGEAEKPFLSLMRALEKHGELEEVPNLTFRDNEGKIIINPLMKPDDDLDEYEFTRLDLLQPKRSIFSLDMPPHWMIPVCRGCINNCVTCGGSAYSYKKYLGRKRPAFRSPEKIAEDIRKLSRQGVQFVFLYQDPRMGGKEYWKHLLAVLRREEIKLIQLSMELFGPADEEYIKELSQIGVPVLINISPESLVDGVRKAHGRNYTNKELFRTIKLCSRYGIATNVFSMIALANDTSKTIRETWGVWEQICSFDQRVGKTGDGAPVFHSFGPMVLLDPGSPAFNFPDRHGYRIIFKSLKDYIDGMSLPSWHQWISYETRFLNRDLITRLIIDSIEYSINLREKYGLYSRSDADMKRSYYVDASKKIVDMVNHMMSLPNEGEY
jgi:B12-binding domain/radical SAM domain protein